ncbi:MAG: hypothetical protein JO321_04830, partial [Solirubrobacterales bacterium]|nr:hypothetical protein [Solirubrobacterales bacterium]
FSGGSIGFGFGSVWAASGDSLTRFDPNTLRAIATMAIPRPAEIAFGIGEVWVLARPRSSSPTLFYPVKGTARLWTANPRTNKIVGDAVPLNTLEPIALAAGNRVMWIGDYAAGSVTRVRVVK